MKKRILAAVMAMAMTVSAVPAFGNITGENVNTVNPIVNVQLPTSLNFTLDPFGLTTENLGDHGLLHEHQFDIVNLSNVDVYVGVHLDLYAGNITNILTFAQGSAAGDSAANAGAANTNSAFTAANMSLAVLRATARDATTGVATFVPGTATTRQDFGASTALAQNMGFALEAADFGATAVTPSANGVTSFAFHANVNPFATWVDGAVEVAGRFNIIPLSDAAAAAPAFQPQVAGTYGLRNLETPVARPALALGFPADGITAAEGWSQRNHMRATLATQTSGVNNIAIPFTGANTGDVFVLLGAAALEVATVSGSEIVLHADNNWIVSAAMAGADPMQLQIFVIREATALADWATPFNVTLNFDAP